MADTTVTTSVTSVHEEKATMVVDVYDPGHDERTTSPLFERSRKAALPLWQNRCAISHQTEDEAGAPLQLHHFFVEYSKAQGVDKERLRRYIAKVDALTTRAAAWMDAHPNDDWDIMDFVDDMTVNGMPLAPEFHVHAGTGIHNMDFPRYQGFAYITPGFEYVKGAPVIDADETTVVVSVSPT
jgi:hypothetical protein